MLRAIVAVLSLVATAAAVPAAAEIRSETLRYEHDGAAFAGEVYWDDARAGKRPGVLVVHEWWGLNDYARERARMLAELGYVAFAADMYGAGKVTDHPQQAGEWARIATENIGRWRARAQRALELLAGRDEVDAERLAAIGYCFGGSTVMQLAYSGAPVDGVVSFHGSLPVPEPEAAKQVRARVLVAHGAADPFVPAERVAEFQRTLTEGGVDWQMVYYGGAVHGFTVPGAEAHGMHGVAYDAAADARSWRLMQDFFDEIFAAP